MILAADVTMFANRDATFFTQVEWLDDTAHRKDLHGFTGEFIITRNTLEILRVPVAVNATEVGMIDIEVAADIMAAIPTGAYNHSLLVSDPWGKVYKMLTGVFKVR